MWHLSAFISKELSQTQVYSLSSSERYILQVLSPITNTKWQRAVYINIRANTNIHCLSNSPEIECLAVMTFV